MTVSDLIEALQRLPGDLEVIVGVDDEGNDYCDLYQPSVSWCTPDTTSCEWRPIHDDDLEEYQEYELRQMVVM